jgi:tight adherence protein B
VTGAVLGLTLGVGLVLIGQSFRPRIVEDRRPPLVFGWWWTWRRRRALALADAGVPGVSATQLLLLQLFAGALAGLCVLALTRSVSVAACFAVFGLVTPWLVVARLRNRRRSELREVWPEVVDNLIGAVRAGLALPEALAGLADRGPEQLRPAFARFAADHRATGRFADCLDRLKGDLSDPVGDRVCEALRLTREVGGTDLGRLLRTLSAFLREDARVRSELEARQSWTVNAARLAVAAPWLVLLLLATQSTTLEAYDTAGGRVLLAAGAAVSALAYRVMLRIGRLPTERRILG